MKVKELFENVALEEDSSESLLFHVLDRKALVSASRKADKQTAQLMNKVLKALKGELMMSGNVAGAIKQLKAIKGGEGQIAMKVQNAASLLGIK
tara:strand:+ start:716 stop:997 length:282 start_codon:yes stop_codon:yes gene_type:complete